MMEEESPSTPPSAALLSCPSSPGSPASKKSPDGDGEDGVDSGVSPVYSSNLVNEKDIQAMLMYFSKTSCRAKDEDDVAVMAMLKCIQLNKQDYSLQTIDNSAGDLSQNYPSQLIIQEYEHGQQDTPVNANSTPRTTDTIYEASYDTQKLRDQIYRARFARCRARFPVPVILVRGKYVCRSATLSGGPEIYGRSGLDYLFSGADTSGDPGADDDDDLIPICPVAAVAMQQLQQQLQPQQHGSDTPMSVNSSPSGDAAGAGENGSCAAATANSTAPATGGNGAGNSASDWQLFGRVRSQDIKLLRALGVGTIVDFMVEKKKVKFGVNVTSSEKVDKENRYADFTLISLPYPGCEFFRDYRDNNYVAEGLIFDWTHPHVDATVSIPDELALNTGNIQPQIDWATYKSWDLIQITQNYMRLLLRCLHDQNSGLLIHCISGWDRTPLFVSLLRLSLWADGLVHQSLNAQEILYLTIAYDWMLFGHKLTERLGRGEEIFFFCFYMLKFLTDEQFSALPIRLKTKPSNTSGSATTPHPSPQSMHSSSGSSSSIGLITPPSLNSSMRGGEIGGYLNPNPTTPMNTGSGNSAASMSLTAGAAPAGNNGAGIAAYQGRNSFGGVGSANVYSAAADGGNTNSNPSPMVVRTDSDLHLDGMMILERDPRGSDVSLNSSCSSLSSKSQEQVLTSALVAIQSIHAGAGGALTGFGNNFAEEMHQSNGNGYQAFDSMSALSACSLSSVPGARSPQARRTSPVAVPMPARLRQESSSSLSVGSWQMITGTGSLRSSSDNTSNDSTSNGYSNSNAHDTAPGSHDSCCTLIDSNTDSEHCQTEIHALKGRKKRLLRVREAFYLCYHSTIGFRMNHEPSLGTIIGNIAGNLGFTTTSASSVSSAASASASKTSQN